MGHFPAGGHARAPIRRISTARRGAELHRILDSYGIANSFELYRGDHVSAVADRMQNHVLPFFGRHLAFEGKP